MFYVDDTARFIRYPEKLIFFPFFLFFFFLAINTRNDILSMNKYVRVYVYRT